MRMKDWRAIGLIIIAAALIVGIVRNDRIRTSGHVVGINMVGVVMARDVPMRVHMSDDSDYMQDVMMVPTHAMGVTRRSSRNAETRKGHCKAD